MNLAKLFEMQNILDNHIETEHPRKDEEDRLSGKILALQVELGECANEWRGFKFWSKNQKPKKTIHTTQGATPENAIYFKCASDDCGDYSYREDFANLLGEDYEVCPKCHEGFVYAFREKNPLLEEYVDCLHFILSIGLESSEEWLIDHNYNVGGFEKIGWNIKNTIEQFQVVFSKISDFSMTNDANDFVDLISEFIGLGEMLGFTWDQVEKAYFDKNVINHQRQEQGY